MKPHDHDDQDCEDEEDCFEPAGEMPEEGDYLDEVPEGAALLPLIPEELGVDPLLLATLHAFVFLNGSTEAIVNGAAGEEALHYLVTYLQRIQADRLTRLKEDMEILVSLAKQEGWPREVQRFFKGFIKDIVTVSEPEA